MNVVKVEYNPYLPELDVEINGRPLSDYSSLWEHRHKPFVEWCTLFFDVIRHEVNDQYELELAGTEFEAEIFEKLAEGDSACAGFSFSYPELNEDVLTRLEELEQLGDTENPSTVDVRIWSEDRELAQSMLEILTDSGMYQPLRDNVLVSEEYPLTSVVVKVAETQSEVENADLGIIVSDGELPKEVIEEFMYAPKSVFALQFAENTEFVEKTGQVLVYNVDGYELPEMVENLIISTCLPQVLSDRAYVFSQKVQNSGQVLPDPDREALELLCEVHPVFHAELDTQQKAGRTYQVSVTSFPSGESHTYTLQPAGRRVAVDGMQVKALEPGLDEIQVFADDRKRPVADFKLEIGDSKFITEFKVFPSKVYIGEGDEREIRIQYFPEDATNADEIRVENSHPEIAELDGNTVRGLSCGETEIRLATRETEKDLDIVVQPHLKQFVMQTFVEVGAGKEVEWSYSLDPEDCFEQDQIRISSSDPSVAEYQGGYIVGKKPGTAKIFLSAADSDVEATCQVTVKKGRLFG